MTQREFKFRSWDGEKMWYSVTLMDGKHWDAFNDCAIPGTNIMQWSGLKDPKGILIFEGDILQHPEEGRALQLVDYDDGCFITKRHSTDDDTNYLFVMTHYIVIGNIYQNPNLLTL